MSVIACVTRPGVAPIRDEARQPLGDPEPALGLGQEHDAAVGRQAPAIESGGDLLAANGWKREGGGCIVRHGGCGSLEAVCRIGFSNQILRCFKCLSYIRQPSSAVSCIRTASGRSDREQGLDLSRHGRTNPECRPQRKNPGSAGVFAPESEDEVCVDEGLVTRYLDGEVGHAVAVGVTRYEGVAARLVGAQLAGILAERLTADEVEGLVSLHLGVGVVLSQRFVSEFQLR